MRTYFVGKNAPYKTIEAARDALRREIAAGLREPVTVSIAPGEYRTPGITFDSRDSGTAECPITYKAEGEVIINGGLPLSAADFSPIGNAERSRLHGEAKDRVVKIDLTAHGITREQLGGIVAIGTYNTARFYAAPESPLWCELFINNRRMEIARYPDSGYLHTLEPVREGKTCELSPEETAVYSHHPKYPGPVGDIVKMDADTAERTKNWQSLEDVWTFGYPFFGWADASSPVERIDPDKCELETRFYSKYGIREHTPYYFFNIFEELDAPGEWYLDRTCGVLYLYPDTDLRTADINLSLLTQNLIRFQGTSHITLEGITFTGTRTDALNLTGDNITVRGCKVKNVAGNAILLCGEHCLVENCEISRTGNGGIRVSGGDRATLKSSGNVIRNNHIHHIAEIYRTYKPAVYLDGVNCVCAHNCIHDSAHMAIGFKGNNHVMEYNEIYDVCQIADDSGAIYAGRDYATCGNIIRCNYFHDLKSDADNHIGIFGVYCDDNLGPCRIEKNVFLRCQSALLLHGGHDMIFRNNLILESCPKSQYSIRFHRYGYWNDLLPGGEHDQYLRQVPWQNEIWSEAFPHMKEYLTWDAEKEQCFPHYCTLSENIIVNHKPIDTIFDPYEPHLKNSMEKNAEIPCDDIRTLTWGSLQKVLPEFEEIPFDEIGIQ